MKRCLLAIFTTFGTVTLCHAQSDVLAPPAAEVARLGLDLFYSKYLSLNGLPIISSRHVSDTALLEAAFLLEKLIGHRPDILQAIAAAKVRLAIMAPDEFTTGIPEHRHLEPKAYWDKRARGLGASKKAPAVSCGEENLLDLEGDPYAAENILIHEFAHTIHQQGLAAVDPEFQKKLESTFARAKLKGLWKGKYAGTNPAEYWAEGVQSWFDCNRENDYEHNHVNNRDELIAYDPGLADLVREVFGDNPWRYQKPRDREDPAHLSGYDFSRAPVFRWPEKLVAEYKAIQRGDSLEKLAALPLTPAARSRSPRSDTNVSIRLDNRTDKVTRIFWIDFEGREKEYGQTDPGRSFHQNTFSGHLWLVTGPDRQPLALFAASAKPCLGVVE